MKKGIINKKLITCGMSALLIGTMLTGVAFATENKDFTKYPNDVTAPWGRVSVENGSAFNNITYVDDKNITVKVYASDDICDAGEIKYYLSFSAIPTTTAIADSQWKSIAEAPTCEMTLPDEKNAHTIYTAFKDYNGNVSMVSTATEQTITYNLNGGTYKDDTETLSGVDTTRYYGAPYLITSLMPQKKGTYFIGWSTDPGANTATYYAGDLILPEMVIPNSTLYAVYIEESAGLKKLSEVVEVGDYVNYPVYYSNVATDGTSYIPTFNGWRVLSVSGDEVSLVSAGVPLTYKWSEVDDAVKALAIDFTDIVVGTAATNFINYGFDPSKNINEVFDNKYTARYEREEPVKYTTTYNNGTEKEYTGTKEVGDLKVRAMTKEDIDRVYGSKTEFNTSVTSEEYNYLFAIPTSSSTTSNFASYWLASPFDSDYLWRVSSKWVQHNHNGNHAIGVRPVVTLKSEVLALDKDAMGAWNITIEGEKLTANKPVLGDGMRAVYWTDDLGTTDEEILDDHEQGVTYNYVKGDGKADTKQSKWANAITEEDGSYWVWIPRYAYKIIYYEDEEKTIYAGETTETAARSGTKTQYGDIDILFLKGTSNDEYYDENGNVHIGLPSGYKVHPAFQAMSTEEDLATNPLGKWDEELEGIWVAKYEASRETSTDNWATYQNGGTSDTLTTNAGNIDATLSRVVSKPSVISWRSIRQSYIYQNSLNMHTELNSHEMKNSEWGAVAYLTQSAYGRNGNEIAVNQCTGYYTGAGPGEGSLTVYNSTYSYTDEETFNNKYAWNTEQGKLASTTGNIYGVYDISGGAYEYTAAYVNNGHSNISGDSNGGVLGTDEVELKTKQVYTSKGSGGSSTASTDYAANSGVYGDAVYETSTGTRGSNSWYSDHSYFPYSNAPFFLRGGDYYNTSVAGAFGFYYNGGSSYSGYGFRPVLCVASGT